MVDVKGLSFSSKSYASYLLLPDILDIRGTKIKISKFIIKLLLGGKGCRNNPIDAKEKEILTEIKEFVNEKMKKEHRALTGADDAKVAEIAMVIGNCGRTLGYVDTLLIDKMEYPRTLKKEHRTPAEQVLRETHDIIDGD